MHYTNVVFLIPTLILIFLLLYKDYIYSAPHATQQENSVTIQLAVYKLYFINSANNLGLVLNILFITLEKVVQGLVFYYRLISFFGFPSIIVLYQIYRRTPQKQQHIKKLFCKYVFGILCRNENIFVYSLQLCFLCFD